MCFAARPLKSPGMVMAPLRISQTRGRTEKPPSADPRRGFWQGGDGLRGTDRKSFGSSELSKGTFMLWEAQRRA